MSKLDVLFLCLKLG